MIHFQWAVLMHVIRSWRMLLKLALIGGFLGTAYFAIAAPPHDQPLAQTNVINQQMWNLQNADIRAVIQTIAELTGKNFIIDPRVQGKITIVSSRPMSVDEIYHVFLSMLQVLNYTAIPAGDVIKIIPAMEAKEYGGALSSPEHPGSGDEMVVRMVSVDNVSAAQLVPVLRPLTEEWGNISAYDPSNTLILAGTAANVNRLVEMIHNLDQKNANAIEVVSLKYASAKKMVSVLQSIETSDRAEGKMSRLSLAADEENNSILVSGNDTSRTRIKKLVHQLDTANKNGSANTVVIGLNYLDAKKLAPILTKIAHGKIMQQNKQKDHENVFGIGEESNGDADISIQAVEDNNAVIINAPTEMIQTLKNVVRQLDIRPEQVLVQAIIVRVDESLLDHLGIQWGSTNPDDTGSVITAASFPAGIGFIPHGSLRVLVQALSTNSSTDILATPSIVVLNNKAAVISDGKNVGIINRQYEGTGSTITDNSTLPFNTFERQDVTLQLKVTPQIAPDNTVRLKIDQQNNSLAPDSTGSPDNPTIDTSKINTSVLVNSGDILVLGGLISNDNQQSINKIPILGNIPVLGQLFRYKNHNIEKKNLMIFIRPIILRNRFQGDAQTHERYNYMRDQELREKAGLSDVANKPLLPAIDKDIVQLPPPG